MAFNFDRVVAYGCSFTAGQELADSIILNRPEDEIDQFKKRAGIHCYLELYGNEEVRHQCDKLSSQMSWVNLIAKKMNVPCENRAKLGTGINEFVFNIEKDLATGRITDRDLILVGLTSPSRFSWISDHGVMLTKFIGDPRWDHNKKLNDALIDTWATDNNLMWEYTKHMRHMNLISEKLGGRLKMVMCVISLKYMKVQLDKYSKYVPWLDSVELEHLLCPNVSMSTYIASDWHTHGWGHPKLDVHEKFAEHIWGELIGSEVVDV